MSSILDNEICVLRVSDLCVTFDTLHGPVNAVDGLSFGLKCGATLGIADESGSCKSQSGLTMLGLLPDYARVAGCVCFDGQNLLQFPQAALAAIRGQRIAMIF